MLSSYQVELWKQESFGVPRLLQIEFFRSLLGRELHLEELSHFAEFLTAEGKNTAETALRVVVYENPYARIPLPRDILRGPYDERFGPERESVLRLFAGAEIDKLEHLAESGS